MFHRINIIPVENVISIIKEEKNKNTNTYLNELEKDQEAKLGMFFHHEESMCLAGG